MKKSIVIIGSGPSALMLAAKLNQKIFDITIFEKNAVPARKFLVAGDGGFNLTHSEPPESFITRYKPSSFMEKSFQMFNNNDLRRWLNTIHIETIIGSSKRVFPAEGTKPIDVLNAILKVVKYNMVELKPKNTWKGWNANNDLLIYHNYKNHVVKADIVVFCLGGASWTKTGSDGSWLSYFEEKGIQTVPFQASNCAFEIKWPEEFISLTEGMPLKNIKVQCNSQEKLGELVITAFGLEGGAIYALSGEIRKQLNDKQSATIYLDLKPELGLTSIKKILLGKGTKSATQILNHELKLSKIQVLLLKTFLTKEEFISPEILAVRIKQFPLTIVGLAPIEEAISTVGGIALEEVDENFQFKKLPNHYAIGEMLDWDAPTGGYLLQGCFSMGYALAQHLNEVG